MAEAAVSQLAVYSARPTIRIDEQDFERASRLLIGMEMQEQEGGLSSIQLRFSNIASNPQGGSDFAFEDESELRLGSRIVVYAGDQNAPQEIFRGTVTGLEADFPQDQPPELLVLAEDALQSARMSRRTHNYENMNLSGVVETIASRLSLEPVVDGLSSDSSNWIQMNESDLAFLRRILRRYDADLQVVGEELHVSPRSEVQRGELELELFSQLQSVKFIADLTDQVTEVSVAGWDSLAGERIQATSTGENLGPGEGRDGAQVLRDSFSERREHVGHILVANDEEAQQLAHSVFDQRARRFVCAHGKAEGNPALRVGTHVRLTGVSRRFENSYYVVSTCHRFDVKQGYQTWFKAESYRLGQSS